MEEAITQLNGLETSALHALLKRCCGSVQWVEQMLVRRPFAAWPQVQQAADDTWGRLSPADWREAFAHHPRIGDLDSLRAKFAQTRAWAAGEQAGVQKASEAVLQGLVQGNREYEARFGYIFIVCATGKSAGEMLALLQQRLSNEPAAELHIAAEEQRRIMQLRLEKLRQELVGPGSTLTV